MPSVAHFEALQVAQNHLGTPRDALLALSESRAGGGVSSGLVHSQTSGTPEGLLHVDRHQNRLRRLRHGVITAARLHDEVSKHGGMRSRSAMLTLTYRPDADYSPRHVSDLLRHIRQWCARRRILFRYVWVLELTKAGKPHYHLLIWLPRGVSLPKPDKQGWWPHGHTRIEWARKAVGYMAKYASKGVSGEVPKGARLHGVGGLVPDARLERSWWLCPSWVRSKWPEPCYMPRPAAGGGWVSRLTGEHAISPWVVIFQYGSVFLMARPDPALSTVDPSES